MTQRQPRSSSGTERRSYNYPGRSSDPAGDLTVNEQKRASAGIDPALRRTASPAAGRQRRPSSSTGAARSRAATATQQTRTKNAAKPSAQTRTSGGGSRPPQKKKGRGPLLAAIIVAAVLLIGVVVGIILLVNASRNAPAAEVIDEAAAAKMALPVPEAPRIESTSTFGATGDILIHDSVRYGAETGDGFDFSGSFSAIKDYWSELDYMIANLEVTCGGEESGDYTGYPGFNAPDEIVTALTDAGVDMLLTANNHAYDTGSFGFMRTQEVVDAAGIPHIGTRESTDDSFVKVVDVNGINFGFTCYTYDTREDPSEGKSLNGIPVSDDHQDLLHSFCYSDLDSLYDSCRADLDEMTGLDADVSVFFLHFGDEYMEEPNDYQEEICQKLSDMGVDIIIGGHPHVIQKFDVLEGSGGNTTYCLYSMGNALSSQKREVMNPEEPRGYTEDGLTIEVTYEKWNNGTVHLKEIYILPTWVDMYRGDGVFTIVPLDYKTDSGSWATGNTIDAEESYNRTLGRLSDAYPQVRSSLGNEAVPQTIE